MNAYVWNISNFLTLLGVGRTWACFMGLEMLYKAVAWVFITVSFHLHLASFFSLGASVLCSVWMSLFFPSWNVCLISQKLQALLAVHSPCLLDKKKKDYSDPSINFFFFKDLDTDSVQQVRQLSWQPWDIKDLLPLINGLSLLLTQFQDISN